MAEITSYVFMLTDNMDIWSQALMMGILIVGSGSLLGWMIHTTVALFKMIAGR